MSSGNSNRLLEFSPSGESEAVERILVQVHDAIDAAFPDAEKPPRQFTKTVFVEEGTSSGAAIQTPGRAISPDEVPTDEILPKSGKPSDRNRSKSAGPVELNVSGQPSRFSAIDTRAFEPTVDPKDIRDGRGEMANLKRTLRLVALVALFAGAFMGFLILFR